MNNVIRNTGVILKESKEIEDDRDNINVSNALVIVPGAALNGPWLKRFRAYTTAAASGWMALRGRRRWQNLDKGFILSDHADWNDLNTTIRNTGCERVIVTHGYSEIFARWLRTKGYQAQSEKTSYKGETPETED
jgi:putative mRNA 3-end processing factor